MNALSEMLRKARAAVLRKGVPQDEVDDLVQEAFLRLEGYERTNAVRSKEAFLVSAAVNLTIDWARRQKRSPFEHGATNIDNIVEDAVAPDEVIVARARLRRLEDGIAQLPDRTRRILLSRRIDGIGYREIADAEGMSISAVEKQVARATLSLMKWMHEW